MIKGLFTVLLLLGNVSPNTTLQSSFIKHEVSAVPTEENENSLASNPIEVSQNSLLLEIYSSMQLQVNVNTDVEEYTLNYESMDPTTASVNESGFVEAVKVGKTQIVISVTLSDVKHEKIVEVEVYPIESTLTFDSSNLNLKRGQNVDLKYSTSNPNIKDKDIVWNSSNPSVATVENSVVKALKFGKTTITASIGEFQATMTVSVTVPLDKIEFNPSKVDIHIGNQMPIPDLIFVPFDTSVVRNVEYTSSNTDIVEIIDGNIVPKSIGTAYIIAKLGDIEAQLQIGVKARENEFGASVVQFQIIESHDDKSVFGFDMKLLESNNLVALNLPVKEGLEALSNGKMIEVIVPGELIENNFKRMDRITIPSEIMQEIKGAPLRVVLVNSKREVLADYAFTAKSPYPMNLKYSVKKILASSDLGMLVDGPSYELKFDQSIFPEGTVVKLPSNAIDSFPDAMHFIYHLNSTNNPERSSLDTVRAGDTFNVNLTTNRFLISFNAISNSNDKVAIAILSIALVTITGSWMIFVFLKRSKRH